MSSSRQPPRMAKQPVNYGSDSDNDSDTEDKSSDSDSDADADFDYLQSVAGSHSTEAELSNICNFLDRTKTQRGSCQSWNVWRKLFSGHQVTNADHSVTGQENRENPS